MNILFVCTSNKDRSPALESYFRALYPQHDFKSAGINKYFCSKKHTHLITQEDVFWADMLVFCEDIHRQVCLRDYQLNHNTAFLCLELGDYKQGDISQAYLEAADKILHRFL